MIAPRETHPETAIVTSSSGDHAAKVAKDLAVRSRAGVLAYAVLAAIVAATTSFHRTHALAAFTAVALALVVGLLRLLVAVRYERGYAAAPAAWMTWYRLSTLAAGGYWGAMAAVAVWCGFDTNALVVLVTTAGIVGGATTSLSPDLPLMRAYLVVMLVPVIVVTAATGEEHGVGTSLVIALYLMFSLVQGAKLNSDYKTSLATTDALAERAVALETSRMRAEAAQVAADAANQTKSEFLANMSHELRTPLTAIIGYAEVLLGNDVASDERIVHVETIRRNGEHLLNLLTDVLDLSKIEAGKMTVEAAPCSIVEILAELESLMRVRATARHLDFSVVLASPMPRTVILDPTRVRQIMLNLTGNAIKFTDSGTVSVRARFDANAADPRVVIEVSDTGVGMNSEQLEKLFHPFVQVDSVAGRRAAGTGLGLDISRRFARLMGGDIRVESGAGRGSTFYVDLPARAIDASVVHDSIRSVKDSQKIASLAPLSAHGVRVLLAEDGIDNQRLISTVLRRAGAKVDVAGDGLVAVERALAALASAEPYDIVLMDMEMPELDGYGATARLRAHGYRGKIVALTAHAMNGNRERCIAAGCDDYLTKPIRRHAVIEAVASSTASRTAVAPKPAASTPLTSTMLDDEDIVALLPMFLENLVQRKRALVQAIGIDDAVALKALAHELAGSGGSYGYQPITVAARSLEECIVRGSSPDAIRARVATLVAMCEGAIDGHPLSGTVKRSA